MQENTKNALDALSHAKTVCINVLTKYVVDNGDFDTIDDVSNVLNFMDFMFDHYKDVLKNRLDNKILKKY